MTRTARRWLWFFTLALMVFLAQHIYRWGGPVPRGLPSFPMPPSLVLCLDGIPFSEMEALWRQGHFREFHAPSQLISTFPSDSEVALTAILHAPPAPGYENRYFDRARGRLAGGIGVTLEQSAPYLKRQHYDQSGLFKGMHFVLPLKTFRADLGRLRKRFLASQEPMFVAHLSSTDGLYHVRSPGFMRDRLLEVEGVLSDLYQGSGGQLRILLYSDHGHTLAFHRRAPLEEALTRAGFRLGDSLERPRTVVAPAFGLMGFVPVYLRAEEREEAARILAGVEGVELVGYQDTEGLVLLCRKGRARLRWRDQGSRFRYEVETADPLRLAETWRQLPADPQGYVDDPDLFAATVSGPYPDAAYRLFDWSRNHVRNRADMAVSLARGYYSGSRLFERLVTLHSTHGGLDAASSVGFAMSNAAPLPGALRYNQLLSLGQPLR